MRIAWALVCSTTVPMSDSAGRGQDPSWGCAGKGLLVTAPTLDLAAASRMPRSGANQFHNQHGGISPCIPWCAQQ